MLVATQALPHQAFRSTLVLLLSFPPHKRLTHLVSTLVRNRCAGALRQVMAIYEKHNKDKLHTVDETLDKYTGRWGIMLQV